MTKPKPPIDELNRLEDYHYSLDEIAAEVGMSRPQVTNIINNAIKKIRRELFKRGIEKDDFL
jgi:predicted DNA-binding protein (UPF0251 family)